MEGDPCGYISTSASMAFIKLNEHLDDVLRDMGVRNKVRCGAIVRLEHDAKTYTVVTKVMVGGTFFMHLEPWSEFPSEYFKTRVLLAAS